MQGFMKTPIVTNSGDYCTRLWESLPADVKQRWGQEFFTSYHKQMSDIINAAEDPQKVTLSDYSSLA